MMQWVLFLFLTVCMYLCISTIGKVSGGSSDTLAGAVRGVFKLPVLALMLAANGFFAAALFYGFQITANALTIAVAVGVVSTFAYAVAFTGVAVSLLNILGLLLVVIGIFLLK
jgi:multidrug transporter EmrE-like cation transporter